MVVKAGLLDSRRLLIWLFLKALSDIVVKAGAFDRKDTSVILLLSNPPITVNEGTLESRTLVIKLLENELEPIVDRKLQFSNLTLEI